MDSITRVFISYSHDSEAYRAFVLALANRLRADGLDCRIDQYVNGFPPEGWQRWMEAQIEQASFVLILCTPLYHQRYRGQDPNGGRGVSFEGLVISQTLYDHHYRNTKFIPAIPEGGGLNDVPLPLKGYTTYTIPRDYEPLLRVLTGQPATPAPEIGGIKKLRQEPQSDMFAGNPRTAERSLDYTGRMTRETLWPRVAWIAAAAVLGASMIAGLFTLKNGKPNIATGGDCSPVFTEEIESGVTINCKRGTKE